MRSLIFLKIVIGRRWMKVTYKLLVPALLAGFLLGACAEKEAAMPEEAVAVEEMATEEVAAEATEEASSNGPGGYVPSADELIPGETR
jgi:hypothetical protein